MTESQLNRLVQLSSVLANLSLVQVEGTDVQGAIELFNKEIKACKGIEKSKEDQQVIDFEKEKKPSKKTETTKVIKPQTQVEKKKTVLVKQPEEKLTNLDTREECKTIVKTTMEKGSSLNDVISAKAEIKTKYKAIQENHIFATSDAELDSFYRGLVSEIEKENKANQVEDNKDTVASVQADTVAPPVNVEDTEDVDDVLNILNQGTVNTSEPAANKVNEPDNSTNSPEPTSTEPTSTEGKSTEEELNSEESLKDELRSAKDYKDFQQKASIIFATIFNKADYATLDGKSVKFLNLIFNTGREEAVQNITKVSNNKLKASLKSWVREWKK